MKKSKSRKTETPQRAAEVLQMLRGVEQPTPKPVTPTDKRTVLKKLKNFLKSMHQL